MQELDDNSLLLEYVRHDSEEAFAALVTRHINKVYSVALRHTRNPHQAEEITQAVFVILATKARQLGSRVILSGWLYQTARLTAMTFLRSETRRARREQEVHMQNLAGETESDVWPQIAPLLDAAMAGLSRAEHHAVVLRFFDGKSMKEVGAALGASEDAAKMRVNRAVEKLRLFFARRGVVVPAAVLAAAISANSVQAAPAILAKTATTIALAKGATASTPPLTLIKGALKIMAWTKAKTTIAIGVAAILAVGTTTTLIANHYQKLASQIDYPRSLWRNAGYFSPVSAFETLFWATSQNDGKAVLMSLTPDLQQKMGQEAKHSGIAPEEYFSQSKNSSDHLNGIYGFRLIQSETISEDEVRLHLSLEGKPGEQTITMRKIGDEWKMDQDHLSPDRPQSASRAVPAKDRAVVGIGVKLDMEPGSRAVQITEVYPNSPAAGAGLTTGLIVQKIDGVPTIGKSLSNCVALIRGKAGTEVQLDLVNLKRNETNTVELVRQKFIPRRQ